MNFKKHNLAASAILVILINAFIYAGEPPTLRLHVFYTNDLQSQFSGGKATFLNPEFPPTLGGGASMATILAAYRSRCVANVDTVLLFDGGDFHNPDAPLGERSGGKAVIEFMNLLDYTAVVPGNLDFESGIGNMESLAKTARFPILAGNLLFAKETKSPLSKSFIIDWAGLRIGVFGITSKSAELSLPENDRPDIEFSAEVETARKMVKSLRERGADIVIAVTHLGLPYDADDGYRAILEMEKMNIKKERYVNAMELAHFVSGIDLIVTGMIHRGYDQPWEDPLNHTLSVQNYAYGGNLGLITLLIDPTTKTLCGYELPSDDGGMLLLSDEQFWPDKAVRQAIKNIEQKYTGDLDRIIGTTETTLSRSQRGESPMANLMCDAMLAASQADFAFNNFTGMRADIPIGPITPRDLANVFPFGNKIVMVEISGKMLRDLLEGSVAGYYSGMAIAGGKVVVDRRRPDGERIVGLTIGGEGVSDEKIYRIATTEYLAEGNYGMTALAFLPDENKSDTGIRVRDAVQRYIERYSPLHTATDSRWKEIR